MKSSTGKETNPTDPTGEHENQKRPDEHALRRHIRKARETIKGEHQLARYVAQLDIAECARILVASPIELPSLAVLRDECPVEPDNRRTFEEEIKLWTLEVLSGVEGG